MNHIIKQLDDSTEFLTEKFRSELDINKKDQYACEATDAMNQKVRLQKELNKELEMAELNKKLVDVPWIHNI